MGGIMSITGTEESGPVKVAPGIGDIFPAVLSTVGILAALQHRKRTGEGQYVDVSMVDGILSLTERIVYQYSVAGDVPRPQGNTHPLLFPFDRFPASDGYVVIAAPSEKHWRALCEHMDRPDLDETYDTDATKRKHANELRATIGEWTGQHTKEELFDLLGGRCSVCARPDSRRRLRGSALRGQGHARDGRPRRYGQVYHYRGYAHQVL